MEKRDILHGGNLYSDSEVSGSEKYGLVNQLRRAAVSIASNIAEGCSRSSEKEFSHFVEIALGSAFKTETLLIVCKEVGYLNDEELQVQLSDLEII